jgi:hypothetical protein
MAGNPEAVSWASGVSSVNTDLPSSLWPVTITFMPGLLAVSGLRALHVVRARMARRR